MSSYIASYLLLFLPIIASVFCFLINFKKTDFWIFVGTLLAMLFLATKLGFDFYESGVAIKNDAGLGILSIPTEYFLDSLSLFFISSALAARLALAFLCRQDIAGALNNDNRQLFYTINLLNLFGLVGIFATNNIFNLFIFIEIYCLTFCVLMSISNDISISKLAFQYFCKSALASIMLLLALVLLYVFSGQLKMSEIATSTIIENSDLIFWITAVAIFLKFFQLQIYFQFLKSRNSMSNFIISFAFIISGLVGFYLLIKTALLLFHPDKTLFILLAIIGLGVVFYGNYKMLKTKHFRAVGAYFSLIHLGLVLIAIGFFAERALFVSLIYIASYVVSGVLIFSLATNMYKNFSSSHLRHLSVFHKINLGTKSLIPAIILIAISSPIALMFWANWYLSLLAFDFNIGLLSIVALIMTNLVMVVVAMRVMSYRNK